MSGTILITGASSGLGAGMAREFAARGYDLALCARRVVRLEELREELLARHPAIRVALRPLDVNDHQRVFEVFEEFARELGGLDRVIVNAGVGLGKRIGTGHFDVNLQTAKTNFIAALAQCEAAVQIFRRQNRGHLVTIASISAMRGLPRSLTTYAATKAALAALSEGIRAELINTPIRVTVLYPGYIRTELNEGTRLLFAVDASTGCRAIVRAIERGRTEACVPAWPWTLIGFLMRHAPLSWIARLS